MTTARPLPAPSLLDEYLPRYNVREHHQQLVRCSPSATYTALVTANLAANPLVRCLYGLRLLPSALARGSGGLKELRQRSSEPVSLARLENYGFRLLAETPPQELVLGLEGRFWRPGGDICTPSAHGFKDDPPAPGTVRAAWNFRIVETADNTSLLTTETRVLCADASARRAFLPYWYCIRPASGIIRRCILRTVRDVAEQHPGTLAL